MHLRCAIMHLYWWLVLCYCFTAEQYFIVCAYQCVYPLTKLKDTWVVSRFWWLWIKPLYISAYRLLHEHRFLCPLGKSMDHFSGSPQLLWLPYICCLSPCLESWVLSLLEAEMGEFQSQGAVSVVRSPDNWHTLNGDREINNKRRNRWAIVGGRRNEDEQGEWTWDESPMSGAVIKGFFLISSPAAYKIELCFSSLLINWNRDSLNYDVLKSTLAICAYELMHCSWYLDPSEMIRRSLVIRDFY